MYKKGLSHLSQVLGAVRGLSRAVRKVQRALKRQDCNDEIGQKLRLEISGFASISAQWCVSPITLFFFDVY